VLVIVFTVLKWLWHNNFVSEPEIAAPQLQSDVEAWTDEFLNLTQADRELGLIPNSEAYKQVCKWPKGISESSSG
jgi:hypothetical protein